MRLHRGLVEGRLLRRLNRFAVAVALPDGDEAVAHLPNSGRLNELMIPGAPAFLAPQKRRGRKTPFDLTLVRPPEAGGRLVSVDARLPGRLLAEAIAEGRLAAFAGYRVIRPEARFSDSRFDLLLEGAGGLCLVETKSVTLVVDRRALFPDAPTLRGQRHLRTLMEAVRAGHRAAVAFVIQREDARCFSPWDEADPAFADLLWEAAAAGVSVLAYRCRVTKDELAISDPVPVEL